MKRLKVKKRKKMLTLKISRGEGLGMERKDLSGSVNFLALSQRGASHMRGKGGQNRMLRMQQLKRQSRRWLWRRLQQRGHLGQRWPVLGFSSLHAVGISGGPS